MKVTGKYFSATGAEQPLEYLEFDRWLTAEERQKVTEWFAHKWGETLSRVTFDDDDHGVAMGGFYGASTGWHWSETEQKWMMGETKAEETPEERNARIWAEIQKAARI